ncbi:GH92 family glycosyl hydrolase [uncultured Draconibacterium sp.]|uniref:GH92 family glycosyl hydrolase n=1 Tax=uncultured Draconibacterium sp. TaxID=1573823 RepID=UPI0029C08F71|nr:GH92 family glycosyl hydrolase [uncultured Draconibacterium sp.]
MKEVYLFLCIVLLVDFDSNAQQGILQYVNPLIGTDTWQSDISVAGHEDPSGYTYPGVTEPFGKTEWTAHTIGRKEPDQRHHRVPYWYSHKYISGFLGTHYPSGAVMFDYGAVELMPVVGQLKTKPEERSSSYSHDTELSRANYYEVFLDDYNVKIQMSATKNASIHNYTFPASDSSYVLVDAMPSVFTAASKASIRIDPEKREVSGRSALTARGYRETGYFVVQFDKDFDGFGTSNHNKQYPEVIESEYLFVEKNGKLQNGLLGTYKQEDHVVQRIDSVVDFNWNWYKPANDFSFIDYTVEWKAKLKAPETGMYKIGVQTTGDAKVFIDEKAVIDRIESTVFDAMPTQNEIELEKDKVYNLRVVYNQLGGESKVKLSWVKPGKKVAKVLLPDNKELQLSTKIGAYLKFKTLDGEIIRAKIGTSFISEEQARLNIEKEIPSWDIETVKEQTGKKWEEELSVIELKGCDDCTKQIFYTALYHSLLLPRNISEQGKYRSPFDGKVYEGESYTDYSIWDTYRATHPLLVLLKPQRVPGLIKGLLNAYDEGGWMPKWPNPGYTNCMYGTHGDAVIADAYVKGVRGFDVEKAEEAMMKNAYEKGDYIYWGRWGVEDYNTLGYVPIDVCLESVARTMEFSFDDYCIAQFLKEKGNSEKADVFYKRSERFKNVLDDETKLVRAKNRDGSWCHPDDGQISLWSGYSPKEVYNYKKNYTLAAPHNVPALIDFLGSNDNMTRFLDELFEEDIYYVGDEFSMHAPYMYNFADMPWRTQERVSNIVANYYLPVSGGLPGNDDCGQLSSWYIFSAMGFYPLCPGSADYQIGTPCLPDVAINLNNGIKFRIKANNISPKNIYIQSATLNGEVYSKTVLNHYDILKGGELVFEMGDKPSSWGTDEEVFKENLKKFNHPYKCSTPYLINPEKRFHKEAEIQLAVKEKEATIYYTLDGTDPDEHSIKYEAPITIDKSVSLKAIAIKHGSKPSSVYSARLFSSILVQLDDGYPKITFDNVPKKYGATDGSQLVDLEFGSTVFKDGKWTGVNEKDLIINVDLGKEIEIREVELNTLSSTQVWRFPPYSISILAMDNKGELKLIASKKCGTIKEHLNQINSHLLKFEEQKVQKLKIKVKNYGKLPNWHPGAGKRPWIFVDEININ